MNIKLIPVRSGVDFTFPALPEQIKGKRAAKYQSFDIISQGTVKVPKGTDVAEVSWDGEFFGKSKRKEAIVKRSHWQEPEECVDILIDFMQNETVLNLIVTDSWINMDVTISSFQPVSYGAYGNIKYSITFIEKKPLKIYATNELQISAFAQQTTPRNEAETAVAAASYTVQDKDNLWKIAQAKCGSGSKWTDIYNANVDIIESTAKAHGKSSSDKGHWIWAGTILVIP